MPDNTWLTPYLFTQPCLSLGPSQGIVYDLDDAVAKVPFQYPIDYASDELEDHIYQSLQSLQSFKRERQLYEVLAHSPHPHIARELPSDLDDCLFLEKLRPLDSCVDTALPSQRFIWIVQLVDALSWLENLGYLHGDIKKGNIGVDVKNNLKIFDFGSATHVDDEDFTHQAVEDHFGLATCIHFLASGIDPFDTANSKSQVQKLKEDLISGQYTIAEEARVFRNTIREGWSKKPRDRWSFSRLQPMVGLIKPQPDDDTTRSHLQGVHESCYIFQLQGNPDWIDEHHYMTQTQQAGIGLHLSV